MLNRAAIVDRNFVEFCKNAAPASAARRNPSEPIGEHGLDGDMLIELFESQVISRHLDLMARELRRQGRGFYTIGSSGHEGNAVLGRVCRYTDPAFLHYRSGALMAERSRQLPGQTFIRDTLLSMMASRHDPISGGRHKVWGSVAMCVLPQTSTIASHLPKAVGAAVAIPRARRLNLPLKIDAHGEIPRDSIVLCNFGDASANHSVATGAINTACYIAHQKLPCPALLVCEDNGIGISVHTPSNWISAAYGARPGLRYFAGDGLDLVDAWRAANDAARYVRETRAPAFLHLRTVRLLGHAGTDVETEYHSLAEIAQTEARDPLLASAGRLIDFGLMTADEVLSMYERVRATVQAAADEIGDTERITTAAEVTRALAPYSPDKVAVEATRVVPEERRLQAFELKNIPGFPRETDGPRLPEHQPPRHMAALINWGLHDLLAKYDDALVFGEDVARKGGVYHLTAGLTARFGVGRVFNTLLDETSILGMALGAAHLGLMPFPEIQYLAYLHNAIDQLRGEALSTQFFSNDQFRNPMVVRIASLAYQKGFGGHFHNDNSFAALRDIPGLIVAIPSRGDDAVGMLRTCAALARIDGRVCAFLEPIALYMTKDLHDTDDNGWSFAYPAPDTAVAFGEGRVYHEEANDLTILTFGNGVHMSLRAARRLQTEHDIAARVVDLRWLNPLNAEFILEQSLATGRVLVVDEGRYSGGASEPIMALILERAGGRVICDRLTGRDTYIPLGAAANLVLPTEPDVVEQAVKLVSREAGVNA
ncbi:MAG: hypothetical protein KDA32_09955 [Phycisphaerales bacterium]|nr:hypothetical protein [Phycisphaerales bacterium]